MLDIQQKRKLRSIMYSGYTLVGLFLLMLVFVHSTWSAYQKRAESESLMNVSKERVDQLRKRNADLDEKITRLDTEVGIEEEIRSKFTVTKADENMVVVVPKNDKVSTSTPNKQGLWGKFMRLFR